MLPDCSIPSWSRDGKSIYFAAKIADKFEVVRMPTEGGEFTQITHGGGTASSESVDGRYIYYNRRIQESWSLRRSNLDGGQDEEVIPNMQDRAFAVSDSGIYFIPMPGADGRSSICFLNIASREVTSITSIQKPQRRPIVLAPDGSFLLFSQLDHWGKDLALLEGVP
jgi:Tol biopolymer transport system component